MSPRIVVAGGAGFIGQGVVKELAKLRKYQILVVDDLSGRNSKAPNNERCIFLKTDLRDQQATATALADAEICICLAARSSGIGYFDEHPAEMQDDNIRILSSLFNAAKTVGISRMIYISSSCVFNRSNTHPITEATIDSSPSPPPGYPFSKLVGEHYCKAFFQQHGIQYTILRPFNVYGPGELPAKAAGTAHVVPDLAWKIITRKDPLEIFGDGRQTRSFTYIDDVAAGIILAVRSEQAINNEFNLGYPTDISIFGLAQKLWDICKRTEPFRVKALGPISSDVRRRAVDISAAKLTLGWEPRTNLETGLSRTVKWLRKELSEGRLSSEHA